MHVQNNMTCTGSAYAPFTTTVPGLSIVQLIPLFHTDLGDCILRKRILLHRSIPNPRKLRKIRLPEALKADGTIIDYRYNR